MADRPSDVKKKLDELYRKTDEIRHSLIEIHHMLTGAGFFEETRRYQQPQPVYTPPPPPVYTPPVVVEQVVPPVMPPPPVVPNVQPEPVVASSSLPPMPKYTPPVQPTKPGFFERNPDLEKFIGERLVTFIGIAVLVTGIAFFVKYAIDKDWINEIGRTAIGILCGGILIGVAHRLRKSYTTFSSVLAGGGIATLYFTISYSFQVYHIFSQPVALALLVVVTLFTVLLSVAYDRKELAILAIVGGFASPLMVKTGDGNFVVLCIYMLILDAGMLALAYYKKWNIVTILSFVFTILFYAGALQKDIVTNGHVNDGSALLFGTLFYFTFFLMNIINNVKAKRKFEAFEIISMLANTGLYYAASYYLLHRMELDHFTGLFTLVLAAFNFVFAYLLFKRQEVDRTLVYFLVGIVITFVSLAAPVQLNGNHITLFWAAEAVLLLWLYMKSRLAIIKVFSVLINVVLVLSLAYNWMNVYLLSHSDISIMSNKGFITTLGAVLSLALSAVFLRRHDEEYIGGTWSTDAYGKLLRSMAVFILFIGGFLELEYQLVAHKFSGHGIAVISSCYFVVFILAAWYAIKPLGMEFLRWTVRISILAMMVLTLVFPHFSAIHVRDSHLLGGSGMTPYLWHYVHSIAILVLGFICLRDFSKEGAVPEQLRNVYLWLLCTVSVFILSAELDHLIVMAYSVDPGSAGWSINDVRGNINDGLAMSHKVGFPIIWGISSFAMILIGMRRKNRQLRIISLVLFFITVVKLVLLGIYGESQTGKITAFILCGVILLLVSFLYQKLKKLILDDKSSTTNEATDEKPA